MTEQNNVVPANFDILPADMDKAINNAKLQRTALDKFLKEVMVPGVDYDRVPGTDKPTLLKSGAELLCQLFRLSPGKLEILHVERDLDNNYIAYDVGMYIIHRESGMNVSYGIGASNSYEKKYRWRKTQNEEGEDVMIQNPDIMDQHNTLMKMAAKRALVDGIMKATGASRLFTQDMEDFNIPESASKKQINYIRQLLKGKSEAEMVAKVSELLGREVEALESITREDASSLIEELKKDSQPSANGNGNKYTCSECGAGINQAVNDYSTKHYNKPLCRDCQKKAKNGQNNTGASGSNGLNWTQFWSGVKEIGLTNDQVHDEARTYFGKPDMQSLKEVISSNEDMDKFLNFLKENSAPF